MSQSEATKVFQRRALSIPKGKISAAARDMGISRKTLERWQAGKVNPTLSLIATLADHLKLSIAEVVAEDWSPDDPYSRLDATVDFAELVNELRTACTAMEEKLDRLGAALPRDLARSGIDDHLAIIFSGLPVGFAILEGNDFRYYSINETLAAMNGLSVKDHLGKPIAEVLPETENIVSNLRKVRAEGKAIFNREFGVRLPSDSDTERRLIDSHFPMVVNGKVAVGAVVCDVTERNRGA